MKIIICDRCGKEIDYSQGLPVFSVTRTNSGIIMDMCKHCRIALVKFMHCEDEKIEIDGEGEEE